MRAVARLAVRAAGLVLVAILYPLRPFLKLKIGRLRYDRIGNLAVNTELFLRQRALRDDGARRVFLSGTPCNRQLLTMIRRRLSVVESPPLAKGYEICRDLLDATHFHESLTYRFTEFDLFDGGPPSLSFTEEEEARGRAALRAMGIGPSDWFVCLHNRDSAYLDASQPGGKWGYHDYRDCLLENFLPAADYVAERGGFVLRMGQAVKEPLAGVRPRLIDYTSLHRSDFLDVYLLAKCRFMIGSDAGLAQVPVIFNRPVVNTNVPFIDWASFRSEDIFIQKRLFSEAEGRALSYPEILARGWQRFYRTEWLDERRLRLIENTGEDILEAVREMHERLEGRLVYTAEDDALQVRYRALLGPAHVFHGFRSRLGRDFLYKNKELILPTNQAATQ